LGGGNGQGKFSVIFLSVIEKMNVQEEGTVAVVFKNRISIGQFVRGTVIKGRLLIKSFILFLMLGDQQKL